MKLEIPIYSSDMFSWENGCGVAERSDFTALAGKFGPLYSRVYDDACDVGFNVESERTGKLMTFFPVWDEDGYDGEMEVFTDQDRKFTITILND
jgi:hypothetical protein